MFMAGHKPATGCESHVPNGPKITRDRLLEFCNAPGSAKKDAEPVAAQALQLNGFETLPLAGGVDLRVMTLRAKSTPADINAEKQVRGPFAMSGLSKLLPVLGSTRRLKKKSRDSAHSGLVKK